MVMLTPDVFLELRHGRFNAYSMIPVHHLTPYPSKPKLSNDYNKWSRRLGTKLNFSSKEKARSSIQMRPKTVLES